MIKTIFIALFLFLNSTVFSQEKDSVFTLCDTVGLWPYYYPDLEYQGGFWEIKKHYKKTYPVAEFKNLKNNSGIITVQFHVNCKGQTGNFKVLQCDLDYKVTVMNEIITNYFLSQTKLLKKWIPAVDEKGNVVNSHKFFSFKLKEGELLEILPK